MSIINVSNFLYFKVYTSEFNKFRNEFLYHPFHPFSLRRRLLPFFSSIREDFNSTKQTKSKGLCFFFLPFFSPVFHERFVKKKALTFQLKPIKLQKFLVFVLVFWL